MPIYTQKETNIVKLWNLGYNIPKIKQRTGSAMHFIRQVLRKAGLTDEQIEAKGV